jgi:hypothetical protein
LMMMMNGSRAKATMVGIAAAANSCFSKKMKIR